MDLIIRKLPVQLKLMRIPAAGLGKLSLNGVNRRLSVGLAKPGPIQTQSKADIVKLGTASPSLEL
jgi:hypothetical protein